MVECVRDILASVHQLKYQELLSTVVGHLPDSTTCYLLERTLHQAEVLQAAKLCAQGRKLGSSPLGVSDCSHHLIFASDSVPVALTREQLQIVFSTSFSSSGWLIPLAAAKRNMWLVVTDPQNALNQDSVDKVFYLQGWLFSRHDYESAQNELERATSWIENELEEISELQRLMLPDDDIAIPGAKIAFTYLAQKGAGGDYLDVMDLSKDHIEPRHDIGAIVADVTGHGPSAAVEAAMLDAILRTFKPSEDSEGPSEVLGYINQHFFTRKERGRFLTANIFRYLGEERMLTYANAGHPHAYIKRGENLLALREGGIPIGVVRDYKWSTQHVPIEAGDILFIYTDVVIETKNSQGEEFGFERLEQAIKASPNDPALLTEHIENSMKFFCNCKGFQDDLTICAIQLGV